MHEIIRRELLNLQKKHRTYTTCRTRFSHYFVKDNIGDLGYSNGCGLLFFIYVWVPFNSSCLFVLETFLLFYQEPQKPDDTHVSLNERMMYHLHYHHKATHLSFVVSPSVPFIHSKHII